MRAFMVFHCESGSGRLQRHTLKERTDPAFFFPRVILAKRLKSED